MAVTVNGSVGSEVYQNAATTKDYTFTVASGSNLALVVTLVFGARVSSITCVWDQGGTNQSMTNLVQDDGSTSPAITSAVFGLRNPTVGASLTLRVSWTTTAEVFIAAACFAGVDQTNDAAAFPHTAALNNSTPANTVALTSASGNLVIYCCAPVSFASTPTGTTIYDDSVSGALINAMAGYDNGASTVNIGADGLCICISGVDVAATSGGGSTFTPVVMVVS